MIPPAFRATSLFEDSNIPPLTRSDGLTSLRARTFRLDDPADSAYDGYVDDKFAAVSELVSQICSNLDKFEFGRRSLKYWEANYIFPSQGMLERYSESLSRSPNDTPSVLRQSAKIDGRIVNQSMESIDLWVHREIISRTISPSISSARQLTFVLGPTGCGKSSFNKFIATKYFPLFRDNGIVVSRIEYRKLYNYLNDNGAFEHSDRSALSSAVRPLFNRFLRYSLARDLLQSLFCDLDEESPDEYSFIPRTSVAAFRDDPVSTGEFDFLDDGPNSAAVLLFQEFISTQCPEIDSREFPVILSFIKSWYYKYRFGTLDSLETIARRDSWRRENLALRSTSKAVEAFLAYAQHQKIKFYIIFDGFDYITAADFMLKTTHSVLMDELSSWVMDSSRRVEFENIATSLTPRVHVTMRTNTYSYFFEKHSTSIKNVERRNFYISPPSFGRVMHRLRNRMLTVYRANGVAASRDFLPGFGNMISSAISRQLNIGEDELDDLFGGNVRHMFNFLKNLVAEIMDRLRAGGINPDEISETALELNYGRVFSELGGPRSYRVLEMLLFANKSRYHNFVRVEQIEQSKNSTDPFIMEKVLRDDDERSGYLGNILNYHIPYHQIEDLHGYIEKMRILYVLNESRRFALATKDGAPSRVESVSRDDLRKEMQNRNWGVSEWFEFSIVLLVREGLVELIATEGDAELAITSVGILMIEKLYKNFSYISAVFFGCSLPSSLKGYCNDVFRREVSREVWVASAIFHAWIVLRIIKTIELPGNRFEPDRRVVFYHEMRRSVQGTCSRIIGQQGRYSRASSPVPWEIDDDEHFKSRVIYEVDRLLENWRRAAQ